MHNQQIRLEFNEPLDTAVFTTKFVLDENRDITYVTHEEEDGVWQFFSDDKFEDFEEVAKVIGLGEIIEIDNSILALAEMPEGYYAFRRSIKDKWEIKKHEK